MFVRLCLKVHMVIGGCYGMICIMYSNLGHFTCFFFD